MPSLTSLSFCHPLKCTPEKYQGTRQGVRIKSIVPMSVASRLQITKLIEAGCTVGDLRKLAFTPREIRELGHFSFAAMRECLHAELLKDAGFTIKDFKDNNVPWDEVKKSFPVEELSSVGFREPPPVVPTWTPKEQERIDGKAFWTADRIDIEDKCRAVVRDKQTFRHVHKTSDGGLTVEISYASDDDLRRAVTLPTLQQRGYQYDGSGDKCFLCTKHWELTARYTSSDGMCGIESGQWVCRGCHLHKKESYEGYGSIFLFN